MTDMDLPQNDGPAQDKPEPDMTLAQELEKFSERFPKLGAMLSKAAKWFGA